jgi:hypothetical protein
MPMPVPDAIKKFEEMGFNPFAILFSWGHAEDALAAQRMFNLHEKLESKGIQCGHGWYLTGKRTMMVIGWTDSNLKIQDLCLSVTYGSAIDAEVCHIIDIHNLATIVEKSFGRGK